jgi:hypothetical protein
MTERRLFIFDYDDCLFPSTALAELGISIDANIDASKSLTRIDDALNLVSSASSETLRKASQFNGSKVLVITNAESGWIELTSKSLTPSLMTELVKVEVLSARTLFEHQGFKNGFDWKEKAFEFCIDRFLKEIENSQEIFKEVISIGDSHHERHAVINVCKRKGLRYKSIKMLEKPCFNKLYRQHLLIQAKMEDFVVNVDEILDLKIQLY